MRTSSVTATNKNTYKYFYFAFKYGCCSCDQHFIYRLAEVLLNDNNYKIEREQRSVNTNLFSTTTKQYHPCSKQSVTLPLPLPSTISPSSFHFLVL
ncbi:hypothetical protein PPL_02621 [Heterostelium album PN500]|uniref:Uncharacterized protein n=1 Tax=Heterostelium pallidum (strain ATCC 26659 / Pp 5 / PN500) TaxID=670386 RepID=D3B2K7_HETP5|nr:hypothetical protein PPL_02621 [Heterostelium album PN500]EFA83555.1 hypothetical protein PPL_02621 [Heterostelium album PN500]|eukprot:XP_020435672.1 hypothetical protein PPL_02621 [Heterostelium album PN500]